MLDAVKELNSYCLTYSLLLNVFNSTHIYWAHTTSSLDSLLCFHQFLTCCTSNLWTIIFKEQKSEGFPSLINDSRSVFNLSHLQCCVLEWEKEVELYLLLVIFQVCSRKWPFTDPCVPQQRTNIALRDTQKINPAPSPEGTHPPCPLPVVLSVYSLHHTQQYCHSTLVGTTTKYM